MNDIRSMAVLPITITGLFVACGGANQGPAVPGTQQPPGVTEAQGGADMAVVERLTEARCDQEERCRNIGPGAKYASRSVCMEQLHGAMANDLNAYDCPRGLNSYAVDRCMAAIKNKECSHPFDTLTRYDKCRTGALCMK